MPAPTARDLLFFLMLGAAAVSGPAMAGATGDDGGSSSLPSRYTCQHRDNQTSDQLLACIRQPWLWSHLVDFQRISDQNPDAQGHGNRNTGTSGYKASVDYVANLMRQAGYQVTVQSYPYWSPLVEGTPGFEVAGRRFQWNRDWFVAHLSPGGTVAAPMQALGGQGSGCGSAEFSHFVAGHVALLQRGDCSYDEQVNNAVQAGASAVIVYNDPDRSFLPDFLSGYHNAGPEDGRAFQAKLHHPAPIPVVGVISNAAGSALRQQLQQGKPLPVKLNISTRIQSGTDYNLIAESPYGNPDQTVVVEGHLDAIYGAGILDNASGSSTILEVALSLAHTPTLNRLRYIWFGGEELGLLGSKYYTQHLSTTELQKLVFDIDVDVTATPNYDYVIADPGHAPNAKHFPANVVPDSQIGNQFFADYFSSIDVPSQPASFGNEGTDSNSFALVGVPDTGILTMQDCCKRQSEVDIWGGYTGDYEGKVPGFLQACVDHPNRWCDNLDNNDPAVMEIASKASAYTILQIANHAFGGSNP